MRATTQGGALLAAAQLAARVAGPGGAAIGHVLIEACDGDIELSLTSTDYERSARSTVDAEIEYPGAAAVDAAKLAAICGVLGAGPVTLEASRGVLTLQTKMARFSLPNFGENVPVPSPDAFDLGDAVDVVDGPRLAAMLSTAAQFASVDQISRPAINAVCVRNGQVMATDGRRAMIGVLGDLQLPNLLIPLASVEVLAREIGARRVEDVGLAVVERNVAFAIGRARIVCRHSDLSFPAVEEIYKQIQDGGNVGDLDAKALLEALKIASVCSADETKIQLISDAAGLRVESENVATTTRATVDCGPSLFAAPISIALSSTLLRAALAACGPASTIRIHGELMPVLVESASYRFILMPMR